MTINSLHWLNIIAPYTLYTMLCTIITISCANYGNYANYVNYLQTKIKYLCTQKPSRVRFVSNTLRNVQRIYIYKNQNSSHHCTNSIMTLRENINKLYKRNHWRLKPSERLIIAVNDRTTKRKQLNNAACRKLDSDVHTCTIKQKSRTNKISTTVEKRIAEYNDLYTSHVVAHRGGETTRNSASSPTLDSWAHSACPAGRRKPSPPPRSLCFHPCVFVRQQDHSQIMIKSFKEISRNGLTIQRSIG